ncbi:carboxypeptidase-like regulatory domain-containing protein [Hymenobacter edaphi]|uniref:Carboxypeptidase-like regulatory domain-containing protein n=1 Tax=Hymenobacter edaphi TaxID=2211146 RepID=A0A328BAP7_9BACT|nr:carboxypeptidase-like regulatory domain-containing protein [Hymenobacter edaphi]
MVCRLLSLLLLLSLLPLLASAGVVRGRITDPKGQPLGFANVAVKGTPTNTASNEQGNYQLPLAAGRYELVFQFVGYKPLLQPVRVLGGDTATVLNVTLTPEQYQLREVVVRAKDRDPAFAIVQHAIDWRSYHKREVAAFTARGYIKALARLKDVPSKVLGLFKVGPDLKPGIIYLSESVSEVSFRQPNVVKERMISSRVSGDAKAFSLNRAGAGRGLSFYNPVLKVFSERGFVSPIAPNAFLFYQYVLEGSTQQDGQLIHKIRVIPRRRTDPVFSGHIFVVDGTWRLHSVSLTLNEDAQLDYVDNVRIDQQFVPAPGAPHAWVLQSQTLTANISAFGFKGNAYLTAMFSQYRVTPTYPSRPEPAAPAPAAPSNEPVHAETVAEARQQRPAARQASRQAKRQSRKTVQAALDSSARRGNLLEVEKLAAGEVMRVEKGANERDSAYWSQVRPVPLTEEEVKDYHLKDSTEAIRNSKPYQDSLDRIRNKFSMQQFISLGYTYNNTHKKQMYRAKPLVYMLQYSTVEGTIVNPEVTYSRYTDDERRFWLTPSLRYGVAAKLFSPSVELNWQHDAVKLARWQVQVGRTIENFDPNTQLTPIINTSATLFRNHNYAKYYQRRGAEIGYLAEVINGLQVRGAVSYFDRRELDNATINLIRDIPGRAFTPNDPVALELPGGTGFGRSRALSSELWLSWRPGQRYITRPDGKINLGSRYPTFRLTWRQGWHAPGSDVQYTFLEAGIRQTVQFGLLGTSSYRLSAGGFLGKPQLAFMDYRQFSGNRFFLAADFTRFQLLDYYKYATRERFVEGHFDHHFNGFFLNKIPLMRRLKWQEVGSVNYLYTPTAGQYAELGAGIEHIFKLVRVDYYTAFQQGQKLTHGFRLGIGF